MSSQTIIWTAVPNGVKNGKLQVSVLVSPRLTGNAKTTTLAEFPSFLDWPATLATQKWTVRYGNTVTPATVVGDKPSSQYWKALFPASTPVNSFNFVDNTAKPIHSYDVAEVHGFIRKQYAQVAEQHPEAPPPTEILTTQAYLAPIGYYGGLDASPSEPTPEEKLFTEIHTTVQKNIFMAKTPILQNGQINADAARLNFAAVKGFFVRQASAGSAIRKVTPKPAPPVLDFHQQVASLGSLPVIMRRVGLVIDLEFTLPPTAPAASTVNVEVTAPAATTNTTPKTAIEMPAFLPAPDPAGSDVKSGMLVLSPPNYQLISLDVEGAALNLIEFSTMLQRRMERKLLRSERQTIAFRDMAVRHGLCSPDQVQTFSPTVAQLMKVSQKAAILAMANQEPVDEQGLPAIYASGLAVTKNERAKFTYFGFKRALELEAGIIGNRNILRTAVVEAPVAGAVRPGAARQLLRPRIGGAVEPASAVAGEKILYASDLVRGYAVDVWDNQTKKWHSVCQRTGTYKFIDPSAPPISGVTDEGFIQLAASSDPNTKELFVNDAIIRWTGWSLAVERPGKSLDNKGQMTKYDPAANTASTGIKVVPTFTVPPGSLPRLRYGTTYRIRARIVDLAGNTLAMDSPQANAANVATGDYLYGRYNPLGSPDLTYCADPKPAESVDTLVIRSNYNTPTLEPDTRRYVTPPVSDQMTAEQYGKFDGPNTMLQDSKGNKTYTVLSTHEGTLRDLDKSKMTADPVRGEKPVIIPSGQLTALPYLPDPIVTGVSLRNLPAGAQMAVQVVTYDAASNWFDAKPFQIQVVEGSAPPRWDPAARVLTVSVPKGEMHENVLISSVMDPNAVTSMGLYRWLLEEGIAAPRMDQLRQLAGSGQHWMFTPYRQITIVHAVQQPIDPPKFGPNFRAGRAVGDTYAILADDNLYVHGNSTQKINIGGTWTEWVDLRAAGPPLQVPGQSVAFETQVFYGQKQLVLPPDSANGFRHEFHDTKHRKVTYSCVATTRYPQFFADKNLQPTDFQRPSATVDLHVPSSKRPDAPSLLYIVPQFKWERSANATKRSGGGLRIYLDRPWYSSGDDEKLAVLLAPTGGLLPAAAVNPTLEPYVTLWGKDPIWNTAPARNAELGVGDFPLAVQSLAGDKPPLVLTLVKAVTLMKQPAAPAPAPAPASKPLLRLAIPRSTVMQVKPSPAPTSIIRINPGILPQAPKYTLAELADNYNFAVNIAPHDVKYDPTRDLWYCDIEIKMPEQYTPFVRLALARYQPYAVNDCHLSKVVRADFIQLTPERSVTLAPVPGGTADQVAVTFTGVVSQTPKRGRAEVVVIIETKQPNTAANLGASAPNALAGQTGPTIGWVPAAGIDPIELKDDGGSPANYRGNITLPGDKSNYRLVIQEFEVLDGGWSPSNPEATRRLVFADAIPLQ